MTQNILNLQKRVERKLFKTNFHDRWRPIFLSTIKEMYREAPHSFYDFRWYNKTLKSDISPTMSSDESCIKDQNTEQN